MIGWTPFTAVYNTSGAAGGERAAALDAPTGCRSASMLVGRPADEATLLRLSAQLEQAAAVARPAPRRSGEASHA